MSLGEVLGYLLFFALMIFLSPRKKMATQKQAHPQQSENEEQQQLQKLLKSLNIEMPQEVIEQKKPLPQKQKISPSIKKHIPAEKPKPKKDHVTFDKRPSIATAPAIVKVQASPLGKIVVDRLKSKKEMIIINEIIGPPKALQ